MLKTNGSNWIPENQHAIFEKESRIFNTITHTIHVWYIYLHLPYFTIKKQPNVGKYTSPMDGMGYVWLPCLFSGFLSHNDGLTIGFCEWRKLP